MDAFQRILGGFLHQQGFVSNFPVGLLYLRFDVFLEVRYDEPCLILEIGERHYEGNGRLALTPLWHSSPHHVERTQRIWDINGEVEPILHGICAEFEEAAANHLWLSQDAIENVLGVPDREAYFRRQ